MAPKKTPGADSLSTSDDAGGVGIDPDLAELEAEMAKRQAEREAEMAKLEAEREADMAKRQAELEAEMAKRQAELEAEMAKLEAEREAQAEPIADPGPPIDVEALLKAGDEADALAKERYDALAKAEPGSPAWNAAAHAAMTGS